MDLYGRPRDVLRALTVGEHYAECIEANRAARLHDDGYAYFKGRYEALVIMSTPIQTLIDQSRDTVTA